MYKQDIPFIKNGTIAEDTDFQSTPIYCGDAQMFSIQLVYTSVTSSAGTYSLQSSDDPAGETPTSWNAVEDSGFVVADDGGRLFWNVSDVAYNWVRVVFVYDTASPEQDVNANVVLKGPMPA